MVMAAVPPQSMQSSGAEAKLTLGFNVEERALRIGLA
jgi:hypothetical protein